MKGNKSPVSDIAPKFRIQKVKEYHLITTSSFIIAIPNTLPLTKIGPIWVRWQNSWRYAGDALEIKANNKTLEFIDWNVIENYSTLKRIEFESKQGIDVQLVVAWKAQYPAISFFSKKKVTIQAQLSINFDEQNTYDYVHLSGNLYRSVNHPLKLRLKVPYTGAFSQVWTIHSNNCDIGLIGVSNTHSKSFSANFRKNKIKLSTELNVSEEKSSLLYLIIGSRAYWNPIQTKFSLDPIHPLPLQYKDPLLKEALKSFKALTKYFLLDAPSGKVPANFIFPPEKVGQPFKKMQFGSFGNCFSLGYIYGSSALIQWLKRDSTLNTNPYDTVLYVLTEQLLPPLIEEAQIQRGPLSGAFFDTYNALTKKWTTGRVQFPKGGYSDWFPFPQDRRGNAGQAVISLPKREIGIGGLSYLLSTAKFTLSQTIKSLPYLFKRIPRRVIYPAYSGQFAYFLLQTLQDSLKTEHFLGSFLEGLLTDCLNLTSKFLQKHQRADGLWDHELFINGTVFWEKRTLACIYPATFLYWWSIHTDNDILERQALKAIKQCSRLLSRGEYFGVYFETNLAINQDDLVTGLACIKCFTRLYELTNDRHFLDDAEKAAWHVLSYMWGNEIYDRLNNRITGGLPVTTYKSLGFPVIGGSELCQAIEVLLELSRFNKKFLPFAEAVLGYHSHYLYESNRHIGATHEIIWGIGENWSTSTSADFASYATGPLIRAFYLYSQLKPPRRARRLPRRDPRRRYGRKPPPPYFPPRKIRGPPPVTPTPLPKQGPRPPPDAPPMQSSPPPTPITPLCWKCYQIYLDPDVCYCQDEDSEVTRKNE